MDINKETIFETIDRYFSYFPEDRSRLEKLYTQRRLQDDLGDRRNFRGHITASGVVVDGDKALLIFHNQFRVFIQPGGHYENDETIELCARREVEEETGLRVIWHKEHGNIPLSVDTHAIPKSKEKDEENHFHHDHLFLYRLDKEEKNIVTLQKEEVKEYQWVSLEKFCEVKSLGFFIERAEGLSLLR